MFKIREKNKDCKTKNSKKFLAKKKMMLKNLKDSKLVKKIQKEGNFCELNTIFTYIIEVLDLKSPEEIKKWKK